MISGYVFCDSFTSTWQQKLFSNYQMNSWQVSHLLMFKWWTWMSSAAAVHVSDDEGYQHSVDLHRFVYVFPARLVVHISALYDGLSRLHEPRPAHVFLFRCGQSSTSAPPLFSFPTHISSHSTLPASCFLCYTVLLTSISYRAKCLFTTPSRITVLWCLQPSWLCGRSCRYSSAPSTGDTPSTVWVRPSHIIYSTTSNNLCMTQPAHIHTCDIICIHTCTLCDCRHTGHGSGVLRHGIESLLALLSETEKANWPVRITFVAILCSSSAAKHQIN